jgi:hypothetical protein
MDLFQVKREEKFKQESAWHSSRHSACHKRSWGKPLKELFVKEQDRKIIDELSKSNPKVAEAFKQDWDTATPLIELA